MSGSALLIQGDAAHLPLEDDCVQCVTTSIPYWGLRSYGTAPRVWGGDAACVHEWGDIAKRYADSRRSDRDNNGKHGFAPAAAVVANATGAFCIHCNAWRGEYGSEPTPELFVEHTVLVFREVRRVLRDDGTLWLNIGDSYANDGKWGGRTGGKHVAELHGDAVGRGKRNTGLKPKDLVGIPWRVAFALQADGWYLRQDIIWHKPNPMPSSVTDRCTTAHEYIFLLTKSARYFYDADAIREPVTSTGGASFGKQNHSTEGTGAASRKLADPAERNNPLGRNKRSVWTVSTHSFPGAHFATFPPRLIEPCIKAGTSERGCCRACGAPWKRVVERTPMEMRPSPTINAARAARPTNGRTVCSGTMVAAPSAVTTGWKPTCTCNAGEPVPCKVLDNFSGAGTTIGVARDLGCIGIGVELNYGYINPIARDRLAVGRVLKLPKPERKPKAVARPKLVEIKPAPRVTAADCSLFPSYAPGTGAA